MMPVGIEVKHRSKELQAREPVRELNLRSPIEREFAAGLSRARIADMHQVVSWLKPAQSRNEADKHILLIDLMELRRAGKAPPEGLIRNQE